MQAPFALIILGMHRSGTSALTGSLGLLGVELGENMRAPHRGVNEKGYWEHLGILRIHERLLAELRSSWDDVRPLTPGWWLDPRIAPISRDLEELLRRDFGDKLLWGVKDPRACRLVPFWREVLPRIGCDHGFVLTYRNPDEVARSLARRDAFTIEKTVLLWLENNLAAERATRGTKRVFTSFDRLLENPRETLANVETKLGIQFPRRFDEASAELREFLTPQLRHHRVEDAAATLGLGKLTELVADVGKALDASCLGETDETLLRWEELGRRYSEHAESYEAAITSHIADLQHRIGELQRTLDRVHGSTSWQVTRPLRKIEHFVSRVLN